MKTTLFLFTTILACLTARGQTPSINATPATKATNAVQTFSFTNHQGKEMVFTREDVTLLVKLLQVSGVLTNVVTASAPASAQDMDDALEEARIIRSLGIGPNVGPVRANTSRPSRSLATSTSLAPTPNYHIPRANQPSYAPTPNYHIPPAQDPSSIAPSPGYQSASPLYVFR